MSRHSYPINLYWENLVSIVVVCLVFGRSKRVGRNGPRAWLKRTTIRTFSSTEHGVESKESQLCKHWKYYWRKHGEETSRIGHGAWCVAEVSRSWSNSVKCHRGKSIPEKCSPVQNGAHLIDNTRLGDTLESPIHFQNVVAENILRNTLNYHQKKVMKACFHWRLDHFGYTAGCLQGNGDARFTREDIGKDTNRHCKPKYAGERRLFQ